MDGAIVKPRVIRTTNDDLGGTKEKRGCCRYTLAIIQGRLGKLDLAARERGQNRVSSPNLFLSGIYQSLALT